MKTIATFLLTFFISTALFAVNDSNDKNKKEKLKADTEVVLQTVVSGTVYDGDNNETLAGATIIVGGKKYYSDLDGKFSLPVSNKSCEMIVELISYQPSKIVVNPQVKNEEIKIHLIQK